MNPSAIRRTMVPAPAYRLQAKLSASDDIATRARHIVDMLGMTGDPAVIAMHEAVIRDVLQQYRELDQ